MSRRYGWLLLLVVMAMLVAACGPQMATPTAGTEGNADSLPTTAPATETAGPEPLASGEWPVDATDWHVLGSPDAPVTLIDYSDFQ